MTVADRYDGKRFNSPNDLVLGADGATSKVRACAGMPGGAGIARVDPGPG